MKPYRGMLLASVILLAALPPAGCSNSLDGGTGPSGSVIRVTTVTPASVAVSLYGTTDTMASVALVNESRPNTPEGQSTNSYVTMNRYRVDFTGLNKTVKIPSIDGAGFSVGIPADGAGTMDVIIVDLATLDYIRNHYPTIGYGDSLTLRATITMWGEDAFKVRVSAQAHVTLDIS